MAHRGSSQEVTRPGRDALRAVLCLIGIVATVEGARGVVGGGEVTTNVDSEYRF